jgi:hypothetical protein
MIPRHRIVKQLESELAQAKASTADGPKHYDQNEHPTFFDGYWRGRIFGIENALAYLTEK